MHVLSPLIILLGWAASQLPADPPRGLRWSRGTEVRYGVVGAVPANLDLPRFTAAVDAAFTTWERPCSSLTFDRLQAPRDLPTPAVDGQNTIRFELNAIPPEVDPNHVIAFTSVIGGLCNGTLTEVDVTFNGVGFTWSDALDAPNDRDIETIMLHEAGHLLGLDHTGDMSAIMFAQNVERVRRGLAQDDLDGVCSLYAPDRDGPCARDADCAHGQVCGLYPGSVLANIEARCSDPVGAAHPGEPCRPVPDACGNGCANNLCANPGVCSALCGADADCPAGTICFPAPFEFGVFPVCQAIVLCEDAVSTCPDGQTCVAFPHPVDPRFVRACGDTPGQSPDGAGCGNGDACAGGLCRNGRCTHVCDSDADCGFPRECHTVLEGVRPGVTAEITICELPVDRCVTQSECPEGRDCMYADVGAGEIGLCAARPDAAPADAPCDDAEASASRVCHEGRCAPPCSRDAHCPAAQFCVAVPVRDDPEVRVCLPGVVPPDAAVVEPVADAAAAPLPDAAVAIPDSEVITPVADAAVIAPVPDAAPVGPVPVADAAPVPPEADAMAVTDDPDASVGASRPKAGGSSGCRAAGPVPASGLSVFWLLPVALVAGRRRRYSPRVGQSLGHPEPGP
jgi:hypothetical protein